VALTLEAIKKSDNVAELLDDTELAEIASQVKRGYDTDLESRSEWQQRMDATLEIAKENMDEKIQNGMRLANVKYPLIMQACIEFSSRLYPQVLPDDKAVKSAVIGRDPNEDKVRKSQRQSQYVNAELLQIGDTFEPALDQLIHIYPLYGTVYQKIFYDVVSESIKFVTCLPDKVVVNENISSLSSARRITHVIDTYWQDILSNMRKGLYTECDEEEFLGFNSNDPNDPDPQICLLEQHCWFDLDEDGFSEPYIVTSHEKTGKVLRIFPRIEKVLKNKEGKVYRIIATEYFIDYHYIRSPDGKFHSMGLGHLLLPLNATINSLINQLIDSGALYSAQNGIIGSSLKLRNQDLTFTRNEWKIVQDTFGQDLRSKIIPLPTKEPSAVLLQMLQLLIEAGKDLISTTDLMKGKGPTQNVPATTQLSMLEQGMKVHHAVLKRFYSSLKRCYKRVYELISEHGKNSVYRRVLDDEEADIKADFDLNSFDIIPVSDPNQSSMGQKMMKAEAAIQLPGGDMYEKVKYALESLNFTPEEIDKINPKPPENVPPPPEAQEKMANTRLLEMKTKEIADRLGLESNEQLLKARDLDIKEKEADSRIEEAGYRSWKMIKDHETARQKTEIEAYKAEKDTAELLHNRERDTADLMIRAKDVKNKENQKKKDAK
jgi:hypothetical protein